MKQIEIEKLVDLGADDRGYEYSVGSKADFNKACLDTDGDSELLSIPVGGTVSLGYIGVNEDTQKLVILEGGDEILYDRVLHRIEYAKKKGKRTAHYWLSFT